jgi:protein involved in polysaccharide export with SLBB domain
MEVLDDSRKLNIGDRLSYRVVEERKLPVSLFIADSGEIEVPLIGRIQAANKTCKRLALDIRGPLEKEYFFKATVILGLDFASAHSRGRVYVTGQVHSQGAQEIPLDEDFTLSRAILRAGGMADFANKRKVKVIHKTKDGGTETQVYDLEEIMEKGRMEKDPMLRPDDLIIVPERLVNF